MKIVFLDQKTIGDDLDLSVFHRLGEVVMYDFSTPGEVPERVEDADVIILNKVPINEETIGNAPKLKLVCVTATGTNNLDKDFLEERNIAWRNVEGYSTESVAQHTFAMFFYLLEKLPYYDAYVKDEKYMNDRSFTHFHNVFHEMAGMTWGIVGLGNIGRRVAEIATAFGCRVIYYSTSGKNNHQQYPQVSLDELLESSDVISIHAPLNEDTLHLIDKKALCRMKKSGILLNVGRGPIVVEEDLKEAIETGEIAAAGLDVLDVEPMSSTNPLREIKDSNRLLITPHWPRQCVESRRRLMETIYNQVVEFFRQDTSVSQKFFRKGNFNITLMEDH